MRLPSIVGYAAVFNAPMRFAPDALTYYRRGAFAESLRLGIPITATIGHLPELALATDILAAEDDIGLGVKVQPDDSPHARLLIDAIRAGSFLGMSFSARWSDGRTFAGKDGNIYREVRECLVWEVCATAFPRCALTCCRLLGEPSWPVDPRAAKTLSALCFQIQQRDGFGVPAPKSVDEMENEYAIA